ncbi:MAG: crossover junction endodeoxyribonuclease RuvC [Phycisphaerae bacterium]|nr:crossover junction endodeoxyribonuclease RuvC [Phycisphaerae bacterium]
MIILGIDPGLRVCGYAIVRRGYSENKLTEAGTFGTDPDMPMEFRLNQIAGDVEDILKKYNPQFVAVEQLYSHYAHPRTSILMGHARGVILQKCAELEIEVKSFSATRIKKSLTGNGRATKIQMQRTVQTVLGLASLPEPADVADAIAVALCCADSLKIAELMIQK